MKIVVNGEGLNCPDGLTVLDLLEKLGLSPDATLVERNAEMVQRSAYRTDVLAEGDSLELIKFVGGG